MNMKRYLNKLCTAVFLSIIFLLLCTRFASAKDKNIRAYKSPVFTELENNMTSSVLSKGISLPEFISMNLGVIIIIGFTLALVIIILLVIIIAMMAKSSGKKYKYLYVDEITGHMNYRKFLQRADAILMKSNEQMALLYLDISSFKYINNVFGYDVGNKLLMEANDYLDKNIKDCIFSRVYADHFVILTKCETKDSLKESVLYNFEKFEAMAKEKFLDFNVFFKVGIYIINDERNITKAVNFANYAVDRLQGNSKSMYCFYSDEMYKQILKQQEIERDMHYAMENGEFEAYYQPKVNIIDKSIVGAEALVRWNHHEKGILSPGEFIPIFEKNRFIIEVDFFVFECVCRFLKERIEAGKRLFPISCNFSRLHLSESDFIDRLMDIVDKYDVPTEVIEIEITETVATEDFGAFEVVVNELKEKGFLISIDDFGSGHSCIQLLYRLPIDVLKFDKDYIQNRNKNAIETELITSIVDICGKNNIKIICEGVEYKEQEEYIKENHCYYAQGFLYARPMPLENFIKFADEG